MCDMNYNGLTGNEVLNLQEDIERYRRTIRDAEYALEAAERELDEMLEKKCREEGGNV